MREFKPCRLLFLIALVAFSSPVASASDAQIRREKLSIPTYLMGRPDPNPVFWHRRSGVYPYPMQTKFLNMKEERDYEAVILENDYIRVIVLPEVGGRILAAHDKTDGNEDFLYHNHVIKPALVGMRGAWLSGGVEWNFPTLGHTVATVSPVQCETRENPDGSATCVVGETEYVRRMWWSVSLTLYPNRSYLEVQPTLYNRTPVPHNAYFWSNAAVHAEDCDIIFPPTRCVTGHTGREFRNWPVHEGVDISKFENIPHASGIFCVDPGDYFGAYFHEKDCGVAHYANRHECPGKKFWTWGTAPSGEIWADILTDRDGQYIEVQAGRLPYQKDSWVFQPHCLEQWQEYWYPVKKIGGFVKANRRAALNVEVDGRQVSLGVNVTGELQDATVRLTSDGKELYRAAIARVTPAGHWKRDVRLDESLESLKAALVSAEGETIIDYEEEIVGPCEIEEEKPPGSGSGSTAAALYNQGLSQEKNWRYERAAQLYEKAVEQDPLLVPARMHLALHFYRTGRYSEALEHLHRCAELEQFDPCARYYRGLTRLRMGREQEGERDLWFAARFPAYRAPASCALARLCLRRGQFGGAESILRKALNCSLQVLRRLG